MAHPLYHESVACLGDIKRMKAREMRQFQKLVALQMAYALSPEATADCLQGLEARIRDDDQAKHEARQARLSQVRAFDEKLQRPSIVENFNRDSIRHALQTKPELGQMAETYVQRYLHVKALLSSIQASKPDLGPKALLEEMVQNGQISPDDKRIYQIVWTQAGRTLRDKDDMTRVQADNFLLQELKRYFAEMDVGIRIPEEVAEANMMLNRAGYLERDAETAKPEEALRLRTEAAELRAAAAKSEPARETFRQKEAEFNEAIEERIEQAKTAHQQAEQARVAAFQPKEFVFRLSGSRVEKLVDSLACVFQDASWFSRFVDYQLRKIDQTQNPGDQAAMQAVTLARRFLTAAEAGGGNWQNESHWWRRDQLADTPPLGDYQQRLHRPLDYGLAQELPAGDYQPPEYDFTAITKDNLRDAMMTALEQVRAYQEQHADHAGKLPSLAEAAHQIVETHNRRAAPNPNG